MMLHSSFWTATSARTHARTQTAARTALLIAATIGIALLAPAAMAADGDGSMESIWMDQPGKAAKTDPAVPPAETALPTATDGSAADSGAAANAGEASAAGTTGSASAATAGSSSAATGSSSAAISGSAAASTASQTTSTAATASSSSASSAPPVDTAAPMCTLEVFKNSALFSKGGWPGVGPFKASESNPSEFVDSKENRVKLELSGDQITRAELTLAGKQSTGNAHKDLLDMQMNADFLLEAVGIKPKRIQDLNAQLEKGKEQLSRDGSLNVVTGRYAVAIDKHGSGNQSDYVISVNSLDANRKIIKQHSLTEDLHQSSGSGSIRMTLEQPTHSAVKPTKPVIEKPATNGELKAEFAELINNWQKIKRGAVKSKQVEELSAVLSGKALRRQSDAIKWLQTNKKYYDMTPKGVVVDQFTELLPAKKYMVAAQVHEAYKFIDETSGKVLKEVDDINKVNYTVEKQNGKWLITDSALLAPATTGKTSSTNKTTH